MMCHGLHYKYCISNRMISLIVTMSENAKVDLSEINNFNLDNLKHSEVQVKDPLPNLDDIALEKKEADLREAIEKGTALKHVEVAEKNTLPTKEDIEAEKQQA